MRSHAVVLFLLCTLFAPAGAGKHRPEPRAFVLVLDRSGSMQGPALDAARDAALAAAANARPNDLIAIVGFDTEAEVIVKPTRAGNAKAIDAALQHFTAGGGTNVFVGLKQAFDLLDGMKLARKHVIVLSDGDSPRDGIADLLKDMRTSSITVSAVGIKGADRSLLSLIADGGDGRLYMVDDLGALPKVFVKEVR